MLSNQTIISPLDTIFDTLWISSEIFCLGFDTVKPSVTSCSGDVHKFIAPGFKLCSLLLGLDLLPFCCTECHRVLLRQQHGGQSTSSRPLGILQISEIPMQGCSQSCQSLLFTWEFQLSPAHHLPSFPWIPLSSELNAAYLVSALPCFIMSSLTPHSVIQQST